MIVKKEKRKKKKEKPTISLFKPFSLLFPSYHPVVVILVVV
jgi:hypothetical protein